MTAKNKANELVRKMCSRIYPDSLISEIGFNNHKEEAKQCALISINEVWDNINCGIDFDREWEQKKYFQEVMIEIEKL